MLTKNNFIIFLLFILSQNIFGQDRYPSVFNAINFLRDNSIYHKSKTSIWIDFKGHKVDFNEFDYDSFEEYLKAFEKLKKQTKIKPKIIIKPDSLLLTNVILKDNIEYALKTRKFSWSKTYDSITFQKYILPYKSNSEYLEKWRGNYYRWLYPKISHLEGGEDVLEICSKLISNLGGFRFVNRQEPIPFLSPRQMLFRHQGSCPDIANYCVLAGRSVGLAVAFDFTPNYAASSNRHFWNALIAPDGEEYHFNADLDHEDGIMKPFKEIRRLGKVFRTTFSPNPNSLAMQISKNEIPKGFLQSSLLEDVTDNYKSVGSIKLSKVTSNDSKSMYLQVFNIGRWKVIDGVIINSHGEFVFKNLGKDLVYLPAFYRNNKFHNVPYPILLTNEGKQQILKPNKKKLFSYTFTQAHVFKETYPKENNTLEISQGQNYKLYYWGKGWRKVGESLATAQGVKFNNIPKNALLRLVPKKSDRYERIFIIDEETNKVVWY